MNTYGQNYYNPYPQQYQQPNPYMQRMENLQQFQQSLQPQTPQMPQMPQSQFAPLGKMVDSVEMVKATDIPIDGNMYYFPTADGSAIFGKQWLQNGTTRILTFKPVLDDNTNNLPLMEEKLKLGLSEEVTEAFMSKFDELTEKMDKLEKSFKAVSNTRARKEVQTDAE